MDSYYKVIVNIDDQLTLCKGFFGNEDQAVRFASSSEGWDTYRGCPGKVQRVDIEVNR